MNAPMFNNKYMAHALGEYNGFKYLNNEPALLNSIKNGHRYFEVDLSLTEDGHMVPSHGWSQANCERTGMPYSADFEHMTKDMFMRQTVHGMPVMDAETLYQYMKKNPEFYWQFDLHTLQTAEEAAEVIKAVLRDFHCDNELLGRVLIQANSPEMFEGIESVYHFNYYQMFIKKGTSIPRLKELLKYCKDNGFVSVALSAKDAKDDYIRLIKAAGLHILVYSLDDQKKADSLIEAGVSTICTNSLSPHGDRDHRRKNRTPRKIAGRIKRKLKAILAGTGIQKKETVEEPPRFERKKKIENYEFRAEERAKYKSAYEAILKREHLKPAAKTVNDFYFDKKIEDKTILISGLGRSVRGSMQYLLNELNANDAYEGFKIYVRTSKETDDTVRGYIEQNGWKRTEALGKGLNEKMEACKYLITESYFPYKWIKKPGQVMIDLWHGTPLKKLGVLKSGDKAHRASIQHKNFLSADYLLYPNEFTRDVMWDSYKITSLLKAKALMMGYPRTSGILKVSEKEAADIKKKLAPRGEHIYAYMPTFRGNLTDAESIARETEFLDYLDENLRDDQILYVNLHHKVKEGLSCDKYKHIRSFPPLIDSYSLLASSEALISDYSSVFFDYLVLRRQIILYIEDIDAYLANQGLNLDIEKLPFDLARNRLQVVDMLNRGKQYDDSEFYDAICAHDSADNPEKFCRLFLGDEEGMDIEPIPDNDKCKVVLYSDGCIAGADTDILFEIAQQDNDRLEIHVGCDETITEENMESAYPMLHNVLVLGSSDENPLSSIGAPVLSLYKDGRITFEKAMGFLHYEYALFTKRMYGDTGIDIMGIYDTTNPEIVLGMALSDAKSKVLFIGDRIRAEIEAGDRFIRDAVSYAAAYCGHIIVKDEDTWKMISDMVHELDRDKIVMLPTAADVINLLESIDKEISERK